MTGVLFPGAAIGVGAVVLLFIASNVIFAILFDVALLLVVSHYLLLFRRSFRKTLMPRESVGNSSALH
jgi:hypothetical protein